MRTTLIVPLAVPLAAVAFALSPAARGQVPVVVEPEAATPIEPNAVNPASGTALAVEALRRRLAEAQLQARLEVELTNIERARTERRRLAQGETLAGAPGPTVASAASAISGAHEGSPKIVPRPRSPRDEPSLAIATPAAAPIATAPRLIGVIRDGERATALVESGGRTLALESGQSEGPIRVGTIHGDSAVVNDRWQTLPEAPQRLALPIATVNVATSGSSAAAAATTTTTAVTAAPISSNPFPGLNLGGIGAHASSSSEATHVDVTPDTATTGSRP